MVSASPGLKQGLVSLETTRTTATNVTPGSALALEGITMILTRVVTKLLMEQIMATSTSKRWDTSLSNKSGGTQKEPPNGLEMQLRNR